MKRKSLKEIAEKINTMNNLSALQKIPLTATYALEKYVFDKLPAFIKDNRDRVRKFFWVASNVFCFSFATSMVALNTQSEEF